MNEIDELLNWIRPRVHVVHGIRWTRDEQWSTRLIMPYSYDNLDFRAPLLSHSINSAADFLFAHPNLRRYPE